MNDLAPLDWHFSNHFWQFLVFFEDFWRVLKFFDQKIWKFWEILSFFQKGFPKEFIVTSGLTQDKELDK